MSFFNEIMTIFCVLYFICSWAWWLVVVVVWWWWWCYQLPPLGPILFTLPNSTWMIPNKNCKLSCNLHFQLWMKKEFFFSFPIDLKNLILSNVFKGKVSRDLYSPPCPLFFSLNYCNPSGPLIDMLNHFRIWLWIRGDSRIENSNFLLRGVIDTTEPNILA